MPITKKIKKTKYTEDIPFRVYDLAKQGHTPTEIAKQLGVDAETLKAWKLKYKEVQVALEKGKAEGRESVATVESFQGYVYRQLPPELKSYWDKLRAFEKMESGVERIEAMLQNAGLHVRKALFIHALICCSFNASRACRKVNIHVSTMKDWINTDPQFRELFEEIDWHKGNFFEECLINSVRRGDPASIIFANKTFNKDRGYDTKVTIENTGETKHTHSISIKELDIIPFEMRMKILNAIEEKRKQQTLLQDKPFQHLGEDNAEDTAD